MGDRASIYVVDRLPVADDDNETQGIYLYTHWNGSEWPEMLRAALETQRAGRRLGDHSYHLRIIVDELFRYLRDQETGGGISTTLCMGEYPLLVLDLARGVVAWASEGRETDRNNWTLRTPIADFIAQERADYPKGM